MLFISGEKEVKKSKKDETVSDALCRTLEKNIEIHQNSLPSLIAALSGNEPAEEKDKELNRYCQSTRNFTEKIKLHITKNDFDYKKTAEVLFKFRELVTKTSGALELVLDSSGKEQCSYCDAPYLPGTSTCKICGLNPERPDVLDSFFYLEKEINKKPERAQRGLVDSSVPSMVKQLKEEIEQYQNEIELYKREVDQLKNERDQLSEELNVTLESVNDTEKQIEEHFKGRILIEVKKTDYMELRHQDGSPLKPSEISDFKPGRYVPYAQINKNEPEGEVIWEIILSSTTRESITKKLVGTAKHTGDYTEILIENPLEIAEGYKPVPGKMRIVPYEPKKV